MINNTFLILSFVSIIVFVICYALTRKIHIWPIIRNYFSVYFGGFVNEKRKISITSIICVGVTPYLIGSFLYLAFCDVLPPFDINILFVFDDMVVTILAIFFGFDSFGKKERGAREQKAVNETSGILFVSIILVVFESVILWVASLCSLSLAAQKVLFSIYFALKAKVLILFVVALHNVYNLNKVSFEQQ